MNKNYLEQILRESEDLIDEVSQQHSQNRAQAPEDDLDYNARADAYKKFRFFKDDGGAIPLDGYVELKVTADALIVEADFYPPSEGMQPINTESVYEELSRIGVVFGLDDELLRSTILQCNLDREEKWQVPIAVGRAPVAEVPEHLVPADHLFQPATTYDPESTDRVDYKDIRSFILVKKDEELGYYFPAQPGQNGMTVLGTPVPFATERITSFRAGEGTVREGDVLRALIDGTVEISNSTISVNETLLVSTDVDYHTGHIDFTGDIIINGQVHDGFRVTSKRSIFCEDTVDVSEIEASGNIIVKRGLIGRKEGRLKAGGFVQSKFIENCYVEAREGVSVLSAILQSYVFTLGMVTLGPHGVVVGGKLMSQDGLRATQIGSATGPKTEIICGVDYTVSQKLDWIRDQSMLLAKKLSDVRRAKARDPDVEPKELLELEQKLQTALRRMNQSATDIVSVLDKNEDATVVVRGRVYPGTYIEICHVSYIVHRIAQNVCFRLNKSEGRIQMDTIRATG